MVLKSHLVRHAAWILVLLAFAAGGCGSGKKAAAPAAPIVRVLTPNGGEDLASGATYDVTWTATDPDTPTPNLVISLDFSSDGGSTWQSLARGIANSGSFPWSVPAAATSEGRVRATATDGTNTVSDASDGNFAIGLAFVLSVGSGQGAQQQQVTLPLSLANPAAVESLQAMIQFDPTVARFDLASPTERAGTLVLDFQDLGGGLVSFFLGAAAGDSLSAGTGPVANLKFTMIGTNQQQSAVTPANVRLLDLHGRQLDVQVQPGTLQVVMSAEQLTAEGWRAFGQGDFEGALQDFDAAVGLDSHYAPAYVGQGWCRMDLAETASALEAALASLNQAAALGDTTGVLQAGKASACLALGGNRLADAVASARAALQRSPGFQFAYRSSFDAKDLRLVLAFARAGQGDFPTALSEADSIQTSGIQQGSPASWQVDGVTYETFPAAVLAWLQKMSALYAG